MICYIFFSLKKAMISLNVLRKNIRCWQIPLKLSLQQRSFGTNEPEEKILSRQRAMVAHRILSLILEGNKEEQFFLSSIVCDEIKKETELKDIFEQHFEHLFDPQKGAELPPYLTTQRRITQAYNKSHNIQNIPKISFFPNRLVSSDIFDIAESNSKVLIMGRPGIAKTTSLILYTYLSSIANKYKYLYDNDFQTYPLLTYYSYQTEEADLQKQDYYKFDWKDFKDNIKAQYLGENQTFPEQISQKQLVERIVKNYHQKGIKVKFVIDQFNTIVRHIKTSNMMEEKQPFEKRKEDLYKIDKKIEKNDQLKQQLRKNQSEIFQNIKKTKGEIQILNEKQKQQKQQQINKLQKDNLLISNKTMKVQRKQNFLQKQRQEIMKPINFKRNLQEQIKLMYNSSIKNHLILNSPKYIDQDLLFSYPNQQKLTMKFSKHAGITKKWIAYEENVQKEWGKRELTRVLIFEALKYTDKKLSQQIMFGEKKQQQQKNLVDALYKEFEMKDKIFTFLQIREFMEDKKEQLKQINDIEKFKQFLIEQIKHIKQKFINSFRQNVQKFYYSKSQISSQRKAILNLMVVQAEASSDNQKLEIQFSLSNVKRLQSSQRTINEYFDKTLFKYVEGQQKLICIVSKETFIKSTQNIRGNNTSIVENFAENIQLVKNFLLKKSRSSLGNFIQFIIITILRQKQFHPKLYIKGQQKFEIQQIGEFEHFNSPNYQLQPNLEKLIEKSEQYCHFAYPIKKDGSESSTSKSVDFMIIKNSKEENSSIDIVSCDITIQGKNGIKNKIKNAAFLEKIKVKINQKLEKDKKTIRIKKWNHYIISIGSFKKDNDKPSVDDKNQQKLEKQQFQIKVIEKQQDFVLSSQNEKVSNLLQKVIKFKQQNKK